jgi:hypothetical protein
MVGAAMTHDYVAETALILALGAMFRGLIQFIADVINKSKP